jgi:hypothetical protein
VISSERQSLELKIRSWALGLQVVVEDYVHTDRKNVPAVVAINLGAFALAVAGIIVTLRIAFGGLTMKPR